MKTYIPQKKELHGQWWLVDLKGKVLGRVATEIARLLRGKHKPHYTPHLDTGDWVVALNASQVLLTGRKREQKVYYTYSGYPGGIKEVSADKLLRTKPEKVIESAVSGMLPKNILGRRLIKKLKIYEGTEHPHKAQKPVELKI